MNKPIYLREETWLFMLQSLSQLQGKLSIVLSKIGYVIPPGEMIRENDILHLLAEQPGPFLHYAGILNYPSLLQGTLLELPDGREILINEKTAQAIRKKEDLVVATALRNKRPIAIYRADIIRALKEGLLFDQISRKMVLNLLQS